ncbi:MAG: cellulase family glycosylhydrolase [Polyangiaceae bacterium]
MIHVDQGTLVDGQGKPIVLRGAVFPSVTSDVDLQLNASLSEEDYQRAAEMGFSLIRLDVEVGAFASTGIESVFPWLDQQLAWAKAHDLSLLLALSWPDSGPARDCSSSALWDSNESQELLVAAWRKIAGQYAAESAIAGYDLVHEPNPSAALDQWQALAARLTSAVRELDREHLLIVEQAQLIACTAVNQHPEDSLFLVDDSNVLYAFEARGPQNFTTQSSHRSLVSDGGSYPDELQLGSIDWQRMTFEASDFAVAPSLNSGETHWTSKKHYWSAINPAIVIAQVNLRSAQNSGTVYFDDLKVEELDPNFDVVRTVIDADLEDAASWFLWQDPNYPATGAKGVSPEHERGKASITLSGTTSEANLSNDAPFVFPVRQDYTYRVTGWMKGEVVGASATSMIGLSLWSYDGDLPLRDPANLVAATQPFVDWGRAHQVPVFVSAFGTSVATFEPGKGGITWVSDMLDVLEQNRLSFCYDAYRGADFGIYHAGALNQPLVDLFGSRFAVPAANAR